MIKRILILNVNISGINQYVLDGLKGKGYQLIIEDIPVPAIARYIALIISFHPKKKNWKNRFSRAFLKVQRSKFIFQQRSNYCQKLIKKHQGQYDLVFQFMGMFAPCVDYSALKKPYVTYLDYTMELALKYSDWAPFKNQTSKWLELERKLYLNAAMNFTTSKNTMNSIVNNYSVDENRVTALSYGLNFDSIEEIEQKPYDGKTILFTGYDFERKGGFLLIEAFKKVKQEIEQAKLIIVGPNKYQFNFDIEGVTVLGRIKDRNRVKEIFNSASVFVLPSFCEPFGLVLLEAMAYKLPCITTNVDAMPEIVQHEETGYIVPIDDEDSLSNRIIELLSNSELSKTYGEAGFKRVKEKYLWDNVISNMDSFIQNRIN